MGLDRTIRAAMGATCMILALGLPLAAGAQGNAPATTLVEPPAPLLPHIPALVLDGPALPPEAGPTAAILKEDGLKRTEAATAPGGWVRAYEFGDATGAFAAYTWFRMGGRPAAAASGPVEMGEFRKPDGERVRLEGTSVLRAKLSDAALLAAIEQGLPKVSGRRALAPLLPTLAPATGEDAASLRYALGPTGYAAMQGALPAADLGWDKALEAATIGYHGGKGTLTILMYPTPQVAGDRGRALQQAINDAGPASFGTVKMRRVGPLVGVTTGSLADGQAIDLVGALKLNQELSFDKPMPLEFHTEVVKTYTLLQSIAIFTGVGILAAVVLGVFLGGARAGIRVLQGKPAASEPEFLTIDLRGQPAGVPPARPGAAGGNSQ